MKEKTRENGASEDADGGIVVGGIGVGKIARICRIELTPEEAAALERDAREILSNFAQIEELASKEAAEREIAPVPMGDLRADGRTEGFPEGLLAGRTDKEGFLKIPAAGKKPGAEI